LRPERGRRFPVEWISQDGGRLYAGDGKGAVLSWTPATGLQTLFGAGRPASIKLEEALEIAVGPGKILLTDGNILTVYDRRSRSWHELAYDTGAGAWRDAPGASGEEPETTRIRALHYVPARATYYVGTDAGLFRLRSGRWRHLAGREGEPSPVIRLASNGPELWYLLQGAQESLCLGRLGPEGGFKDWMTPARLAVPPDTLVDAAELGPFLFLASTDHFFRVHNAEDHSWESVSFRHYGEAPAIRMIEIFDGALWLATDRGLHAFGAPEKLWSATRDAKVPVFQALYGTLTAETDTGKARRKAGVRQLFSSNHALFFVTERRALGRVNPGTSKPSWPVPGTRAVRAAEGMEKGTGYWIKKSDLLCALQTPEGVLVGTRRGVFRYDDRAHDWEEALTDRFGDQAIYDLELDPVSGEVVALTKGGFAFSGRSTPHPDGDRFRRLHASSRGVFYSTQQGALGRLKRGDGWPIPLLGKGKCPAPFEHFTSVAADGSLVTFGTDGHGLVIYDKGRRRWQGQLRASKSSGSNGESLLSDRVWEVRSGKNFLAYRTAEGAVGLRSGASWRTLIGASTLDGVTDAQLTTAGDGGQILWVGGAGFVAAYDRLDHSWQKPLRLPDPSPVVRIEELNGAPVSLTAEGRLLLGKRPIAEHVTGFTSDGRTLVYAADGKLRRHGPLIPDRRSPSMSLPHDLKIVDVAEVGEFFFVASKDRLYAYQKERRYWTDWGGPGQGEVVEIASDGDGRAVARASDGGAYHCQPGGLWTRIAPPSAKVKRLLRGQGQAWLLTEGGSLLAAGRGALGPSDPIADVPILDVQRASERTLFVQKDGVRIYDDGTGRWLPGLSAPEGRTLQAAGGSERAWAVTTDGGVYTASLPSGNRATFRKVIDAGTGERAGPTGKLVGLARLGDRVYLAEEERLYAYDLRTHRWLHPLELRGQAIASLLSSRRFLAILTTSGKALLSSQIFDGRIPHESLERDWTRLELPGAARNRTAALSDQGHFFLLAEDGGISRYDPFVRKSAAYLHGPKKALTNDIAVAFGILWIAVGDGLYGYSLDPSRRTRPIARLVGTAVTRLVARPPAKLVVQTADGSVWEMAGKQGKLVAADPKQLQIVRENRLWRWMRKGKVLTIESAADGSPALNTKTGRFFFDGVAAMLPWRDSFWIATGQALIQYPISREHDFLDPEKAVPHAVRGVTRLKRFGDELFAVAQGDGATYRMFDDGWRRAPLPREGQAWTLARTAFWRWERSGETVSGHLLYQDGKEAEIDLAAAARDGRFPFDRVLDTAASPRSAALWFSTPAGLVRVEGDDRAIFSGPAASELGVARVPEGGDVLLGTVEGQRMRFDEAEAAWRAVTQSGKYDLADNLRADSELWSWRRTANGVEGQFKASPDTPIMSKSARGTVFSFDDAHDVRSFHKGVWAATSSGPLPVKSGPDPTPLGELKIPTTGPVDALAVHVTSPEGTASLYARLAREGAPPWRLDTERQEWTPAPSEAPTSELLVQGRDWLFEAVSNADDSERKLRKQIRAADGSWREFRLVDGRWSFDRVQSMAALGANLWLATAQGAARIEIQPVNNAANLELKHFPFPDDPAPTDARLVVDEDRVLAVGRSATSAEIMLLRFDHERQKWVEGPPNLNLQPERTEVLRGPCWSWVETRPPGSQMPRLEGRLHYEDGSARPLTFTDGKFAFDRSGSVVAEDEKVWLATAIGVAECPLSGESLPLDQTRLHPVGESGDQLLRLAEKSGSLSPGLYLRGKDGKAAKYVAVSRQWRPVEDAPPILDDCCGKEMLVEFSGFWRWWRDPGVDLTKKTQKPIVHIEVLGPGEQWTEIRFAEGRFDFDRVNDVAVYEDHVWLATEAGLCRFSAAGPHLDLRTARLYPSLKEATDLLVDRSTNELSVRLQGMAPAVHTLAMPDGKPHKAAAGSNPFQMEVRVETPDFRWSRQETYEGNEAKGHQLRLEVRDARGAWSSVPLSPELLPIDDVRDLRFLGDKLWLATKAGVVAYQLGRSPSDSPMRFYPETGDTHRLTARETEGGGSELLCLSRAGPREMVSRFHRLARGGSNWEQLEDSSVFRKKLLADGPWHWYRERRGVSVLHMGIDDKPRVLREGRFADEMALAVANLNRKLYAYTPVGLVRLAPGKDERLALNAVLTQKGEGTRLPTDSRPVAMAAADGRLYVVAPEGIFRLQVEEADPTFAVAEHWPLPDDTGPARSLWLSPESDELILRIRGGEGADAFYREYWLSERGPAPLTERKVPGYLYSYEPDVGAVRVRPSDEGTGAAGVLRLNETRPPLAVLPSRDGIWIAYPDRAARVRPSAICRREP